MLSAFQHFKSQSSLYCKKMPLLKDNLVTQPQFLQQLGGHERYVTTNLPELLLCVETLESALSFLVMYECGLCGFDGVRINLLGISALPFVGNTLGKLPFLLLSTLIGEVFDSLLPPWLDPGSLASSSLYCKCRKNLKHDH